MYVTAQRVRDRDGREGINAYYYFSGFDVWDDLHHPPLTPDRDAGALRNHILTLPPGGNRVRSYLDVVTDDDASIATIRRAFARSDGNVQPTELPFVHAESGCWFRFGAEHALAPAWRQEFRHLFEWSLYVYRQSRGPSFP
jgi:hypothetical protein